MTNYIITATPAVSYDSVMLIELGAIRRFLIRMLALLTTQGIQSSVRRTDLTELSLQAGKKFLQEISDKPGALENFEDL